MVGESFVVREANDGERKEGGRTSQCEEEHAWQKERGQMPGRGGDRCGWREELGERAFPQH